MQLRWELCIQSIKAIPPQALPSQRDHPHPDRPKPAPEGVAGDREGGHQHQPCTQFPATGCPNTRVFSRQWKKHKNLRTDLPQSFGLDINGHFRHTDEGPANLEVLSLLFHVELQLLKNKLLEGYSFHQSLNVHVRVHVTVYVNTCARVCEHVHVHVCEHVCMCACMSMCVHVCDCM